MRQTGIVSETHGREATVTGERASSCGSCAGKSSCSTLGAWNARELKLKVWNDVDARVGDTVVIEVPDSLVLKSAFSLYGLPMLLFFTAGIAAWLFSSSTGIGNPDLMAALSGIAVVVAYYLSGISGHREKAGLEARIVHIQTRPDSELDQGCLSNIKGDR